MMKLFIFGLLQSLRDKNAYCVINAVKTVWECRKMNIVMTSNVMYTKFINEQYDCYGDDDTIAVVIDKSGDVIYTVDDFCEMHFPYGGY